MAEERFSTDAFGTKHWPVEIRLKKEDKRLEIDFDDGSRFSYPAEFLRVHSPSAFCRTAHSAATVRRGSTV